MSEARKYGTFTEFIFFEKVSDQDFCDINRISSKPVGNCHLLKGKL